MAKYNRSSYIATFPAGVQKGIRTAVQNALRKQGYLSPAARKMAVEDAMDGRLSNLDGLIDTRYWLDKANGKK